MPKLPQLEMLLDKSNLDFLGVSESWLTDAIDPGIIHIQGYNVFRKDREGKKRGGGVAIYVKDTLNCSQLCLETNLECVGVTVKLSQTMNFNVVTIYIPPNGSDPALPP